MALFERSASEVLNVGMLSATGEGWGSLFQESEIYLI